MAESLERFLESNGFYLDKQIAKLISAKLNSSRKTFLLRGPAGVGKTQLTYLIAKYLDAKYVFYQCTYGSSEDDLLYKYVPSEEAKSGIKIALGPIPLALQLSKTSKVILCIDEFDKTRPSADALMLDVLQNLRVSLYLDDKEQIIEGNPENLVIFLTSNDMREFSEPLLRRVTVIYLNPLPVDKVYAILSSRFPKEIAILLAQIYDDTLKAGLRKPATIQELVEFGEILQSNPNNIDLELLLRSIIIKYDDDWDRYLQYVKFRKPYKFMKEDDSQDYQSLAEYYKPEEISLQEQKDQQKSNNFNLNQVLEEIKSKFKVPAPSVDFVPQSVHEEKEVYMLVKDDDKNSYTTIIKSLRPEPSDDPTQFGGFKVYFDDGAYIVAENPLTAKELIKLKNTELDGEFYAEDVYKLVNINRVYDVLIKDAAKIDYYSNKLLRVTVHISKDSLSVIEIKVIKQYDLKDIADIMVKHYIKGKIGSAYILTPIRDFPKSNTIFYHQDLEICKRDIAKLLRFINVLQFTVTFTDDCSKMRWELDDEFAPTSVHIVFGPYITKLLNQIGFEIKYNHPITDKHHVTSILKAILDLKEGERR